VRFHNFLRIGKGAGNHLVHSTYGLTDGIKQRMALVQWKEKWIGKGSATQIGKKEGSATTERAQYYPFQILAYQ
jgi:hypothetical protein